jgi:hypothetical protein
VPDELIRSERGRAKFPLPLAAGNHLSRSIHESGIAEGYEAQGKFALLTGQAMNAEREKGDNVSRIAYSPVENRSAPDVTGSLKWPFSEYGVAIATPAKREPPSWPM